MVITGTIDSILARTGGRPTLHIRAARPHAALGQILSREERLTELRVEADSHARARFSGDDCAAAALLATLMAAGIEVASFHIEKEDIEDIFLKIGAREVS